MKLQTIALSLTLAFAAPIAAQKMGGTNHNAPQLTQTFASQSGFEMSVDYTAITWADGNVMKYLMDKERGSRHRARVNGVAPNQPLGSLNCKDAVNLGGTNMPSGLYALYFTIDDNCVWHLNAQHEQNDKVKFSWTLDLKEQTSHKSRLGMSLGAAKSADECELTIAFGKMAATVPVKKGKKMEDKPESKPSK